MAYRQAHKLEREAEDKKVSVVARRAGGFMREFQRNPRVASFCRQRVQGSNITWGRKRRNFIARHLPQFKSHPTRRRWLALAMWAYRASPAPPA